MDSKSDRLTARPRSTRIRECMVAFLFRCTFTKDPADMHSADVVLIEFEALLWAKTKKHPDPLPKRSRKDWHQIWVLVQIEPWSHIRLGSKR